MDEEKSMPPASPDLLLQRRANQILDEALDLGEPERLAYLDQTCGRTSGLRQLVDRLLHACTDEAADQLLDDEVAASIAAIRQSDAPAPGDTGSFGPYRLLREIGRGGMGVVHLAARDDGAFERQVAIKVMDAAGSASLRRRFQQERQILGRLEHPGIARLIDGGETAAGQLYLVLELVGGQHIDRYCRDQRLGIRARLQLLIAICDAVAYAHGLLVIHRDIKPSNILVGEDGRPRLLDFGIAQLLSGQHGPFSPDDLTRQLATPDWASPEQIRGDPTTVHSDLYQLGLLLHCLLTGRLPYELNRLAPAEQQRVVCETDKPSPAATFAALPPAEQVAQAASMVESVPSLLRALSGDLGQISRKALQADPRQAYASVAAFRNDLQRYLTGHPVSARLPTLRYRAGRFLNRHRTAAAIVTLTGAIALTAVSIAYLNIRHERDRAEALAVTASRMAGEAQATTDYLASILRRIDPRYGTAPVTISLRDAVELSVGDLDRSLGAQPLVRARVGLVLANAFNSLGNYDEALALEEASLATFKASGSDYQLETARTLQAIGTSHERKGQLGKADEYLRRALAALDAMDVDGIDKAPADLRAWLLSDLGTVIDRNGGDGLPQYLQAEAILQRSGSEAYPGQLGALYGNLAIRYKNRGRRGEEGGFEQSLAYNRKSISEFGAREALHPKLPRAHLNLAILLVEMDRLDDAMELFALARSGTEKWLGTDHPQMGILLSNYGRAAAMSGDLALAESLLTDSLQLRLALHGTEHADVAIVRYRLGEVHEAQGRLREAADDYRQSLVTRRIVHPPTHRNIAEASAALGRVEARLGQNDAAATHIETAIAIFEKLGLQEAADSARTSLH